jgi:hypothetical protein
VSHRLAFLVRGASASPSPARAVNARAARHRVLVQRATRGGGLPRGDVLDDRPVLAHRERQDAGLRERRAPDAGAAR